MMHSNMTARQVYHMLENETLWQLAERVHGLFVGARASTTPSWAASPSASTAIVGTPLTSIYLSGPKTRSRFVPR